MDSRALAATRFDFIVLGGGPAGSATAILLAKSGARVALIESTDYTGFRAGEHLPPKVRDALDALGCGIDMLGDVLTDSPGVRSQWAADVPVLRRYAGGGRGLGLNILRNAFDRRLFQHAVSCGALGLSLVSAARLEHLGGGWRCVGESAGAPFDLCAPLLVDATGRRSLVARRFDIQTTGLGDMTATVALLPPAPNARQVEPVWLVVEACEAGWCSQTPLPDGRRVVAFYTSARQHGALGNAMAAQWRHGVSQTTLIPPNGAQGWELPEFVVRFPAFPRFVETAHGADWFAVGEAALAYDPLTGHGVAFALETAFRAAEMACSGMPLATIGPLYDEALRSRWDEHLRRRHDVYREAVHRFPGSPFWSEFASRG